MTTDAERLAAYRALHPLAPPFEGCEHGVSLVRVGQWWEREQQRHPSRYIDVCPCCSGPMPAGDDTCKFCVPPASGVQRTLA